MLGFIHLKTFMYLYSCLVRSQLEFASVCWFPHYNLYKHRIERIQNKFLSILNRKFPGNSVSLPSLQERRSILDILFLYKLFNNLIDSPALLEKFLFKLPSYRTRSNELFCVQTYKTNSAMYSPLNRIVSIYNNMLYTFPALDLFSCNLHYFKKFLRCNYRNLHQS